LGHNVLDATIACHNDALAGKGVGPKLFGSIEVFGRPRFEALARFSGFEMLRDDFVEIIPRLAG
jgi:hypothetical protein